jgi:hypothetical protein
MQETGQHNDATAQDCLKLSGRGLAASSRHTKTDSSTGGFYIWNRNRSYSAFALPVEASLIGPPTPHISAPKALVCLGWARAFLPRLLAPWSQLRACLPLRIVALCQGCHPAAQGWCPTTDRRGERVTFSSVTRCSTTELPPS